MHLLGAMGDACAVPALVGLIRRDDAADGRILGDALTEDLPDIIARMPADAFDAFEPIVEDRSLGEYHRSVTAEGLYGIAIRHPVHRQRFVDLCMRWIPADPCIGLTTSLMVLLARTGHGVARDLFEDQVNRGRIDDFFTDLEDLEGILEDDPPWKASPALTRDHLGHFDPGHLDILRWADATLDDDPPGDAPLDEGRELLLWQQPHVVIRPHDPCPCGSGRRYDACCHGTARDPARRDTAG